MRFSSLVLSASLCLFSIHSYAGDDHSHKPIGDAIKDVPIFDAHIHYKEPAWEQFSVKTIIELMDQNGVAMGLVSSTPDEGTIMLWDYAPNRIVPELRPYHGAANSSNWAKAPDMKEYLEKRLNNYPQHQGIGEFHIHRLDMDDEALFRDVIKLAKDRDIYLHVHSGPEAIQWLYSLDKDVKIIWAHAGLGYRAEFTYALMSQFPNLLADTSLREYAIMSDGDTIDPKWMKIIVEFQDRLMVGSDTWVNSQWENYDRIITSNRDWLSQLPRDIAEKIAYKNAERIFNVKVSNDQIGTR